MPKVNPTPSLSETQRWFKSRLLEEASPADDIVLNEQRGVPGVERLTVYKEGYDVRIREALAETYEAVRFVLGESRFAEMASRYAKDYHSHDYNLSFAGRHLPEFFQNSGTTKDFLFIVDLAKFEWLVAATFHAFYEKPLEPRDLVGISEEALLNARLIFQKGIFIFTSDWPLLDIWQARKNSRSEINVDLVDRQQRILVFRSGLQVRCELLELWQERLLEALLRGDTLDAACERVTDILEDFSLVTSWFSKLMADGLIVRCETNS